MSNDINLKTEVLSVLNDYQEDASTELGISFDKKEPITGTRIITITINCDGDRVETQEEIEIDLKNKISGVSVGRFRSKNDSIELTDIKGHSQNVRIKYKPRSGGMSETTLNSTITELFPAIAWQEGVSTSSSRDVFANEVSYAKVPIGPNTPYKNKGAKQAGNQFIDQANTSSKYDEKVDAARGIHKWIKNEEKRRGIKGVVWGYRNNTKPTGVNPNHKGDIFIIWEGGEKPDKTGVSIKAGAVGSKPPQFNSYVRAIYNSPAFGKLSEYNKLMKKSYDEIYKGIPNIPAYTQYGKPSMTSVVAQLERTSKSYYEELYDKQLEMMRQTLIDLMNNRLNKKKVKDWLLQEVCKEQEDVPLVVIQSSGSNLNDVHEVTDEDIIKECVAVAKPSGIKAYAGSGKQNWHIDLTCNKKTTTLNFTIRTNKSGTGHKLGQYINLAVKFNGVA